MDHHSHRVEGEEVGEGGGEGWQWQLDCRFLFGCSPLDGLLERTPTSSRERTGILSRDE